MADEPTQAQGADPITPPESHPPDAKPLVDSPTEQASTAAEGVPAGDADAAPDPDAEHVAYLKSLTPEKLLELREDLAKQQRDEINKGVQRTLSKQAEKAQRDRDAAAAAQAKADARAQREADKAAKREIIRKGYAEEWETLADLGKQKLVEYEQDVAAPDPDDVPDLNALASQVEAQVTEREQQSITRKIHADILNDPRAKGIDPARIPTLIQGDTYGDMAFGLADAAGWGPLAERDKWWEAKLKTEVEAAEKAARAEALGELPEHEVPRGMGSGNGNGGMSWGVLQAMSPSDRIKWRDTHPAQYDALTTQLARS